MQKVSIGIVGCGAVAPFHLRALKKLKHVEVKAVADVIKERAMCLAKLYKINHFYESLTDMLEKEDIDAIYVLTNPQSHAALAIEAMRAGKHVLVEKPTCVTLKEADEMLYTAKKYKVILFPIEQFLFTPAIQKAIKFISSGKAGEVTNIYTYASISPLVEELKKGMLPKWFYSLPGGIYGEEIPHSLYTTLKILNENIKEVHVSTVGKGESSALPFMELRILLEGKEKSARIIMTARSKARHTVLNTVINCEKYTLIVDFPLSLTLIRNYASSRFSQARAFIGNFISNITGNIFGVISSKIYKGCSWEEVSRVFINSILGKAKLPITMEEAREWVRITELIWQKSLNSLKI